MEYRTGLLNLLNSGLTAKFDKFKSGIELTGSQTEKIKTSHYALRQVIEKLPYVSKTLLTGSYLKSTMIRPPNDVDIFVVLKGNQASVLPQTVLNKLKSDIEKTYSTSTIRHDRPCVVVDLAHCKFELTPTLLDVHAGLLNIGSNYRIPQKLYSGAFGLTWEYVKDPNDLANRLSAKNKELGGKLVPLIKMMKHCKARHKITTPKSFEMEEIAIQKLTSINSYRDGVEKLLEAYGWLGLNDINTIRLMNDDNFAKYCRNTLFGTEFPE